MLITKYFYGVNFLALFRKLVDIKLWTGTQYRQYFMKWAKSLPISRNGQFHGLGVTPIKHVLIFFEKIDEAIALGMIPYKLYQSSVSTEAN